MPHIYFTQRKTKLFVEIASQNRILPLYWLAYSRIQKEMLATKFLVTRTSFAPRVCDDLSLLRDAYRAVSTNRSRRSSRAQVFGSSLLIVFMITLVREQGERQGRANNKTTKHGQKDSRSLRRRRRRRELTRTNFAMRFAILAEQSSKSKLYTILTRLESMIFAKRRV